MIFFNFRADRARQMTRAIAEPGFKEFADPKRPSNLFYVAMTQYDKAWPWLRYVIAPEKIAHILAQVFAEQNLKNLRCAETEKYAHVTYFFNGGIEKPFGGEERILVPSPKVPTYDLKPEMSAAGIAETVVKAIEKGDFDAVVMNFANADMVGHTGNLEAAIKAVEAVDDCLGRIRQVLAAARRRLDRHRRSRQRRNHDRPGHRRPAHLSHHKSRPADPSNGRWSRPARARRLVARRRAHAARHPGPSRAAGNDRPRSAREEKDVIRES